MEAVARLGKLVLRPVPLSVLLHAVLILTLAFFLGHTEWQDEKQEAEIVMELSQEEAEVREEITQEAMEAIEEKASAWETIKEMPQPSAPTPQEAPAAPSPAPSPAPAESAGAILPASEAVAGGDGAPAAGAGNAGAAIGGTGSGEGSGLGGGGEEASGEAEGSGTGTATEDMGSIASRFAARVEANKEYPYMAIRRNQTGVAYIGVTISAGGDLLSAYVAGSSGSSLLDDAALSAVYAACPFSHGAGRDISLEVPIHFDLQ